MTSEDSLTHVVFDLEQDEDGWPPVSGERLWAAELGNDLYRIDNVPWYVRDLAVDDVVRAIAPDSDTWPLFVEVVERSQHCTIRLIVLGDGPLAGDAKVAAMPFEQLGIWAEYGEQSRLLALDIHPEAPLEEIARILRAGEKDGFWGFEEGRITPEWRAALSAVS